MPTASVSTDVAEYPIRTAPGPTDRSSEESTVEFVGPTVFTFATDEGLSASGATVDLQGLHSHHDSPRGRQ